MSLDLSRLDKRPTLVVQVVYAMLNHDPDTMKVMIELLEDNYAHELKEISAEFTTSEFEEDLQEGYHDSQDDNYGDEYESESMMYNTDNPFMDHDLDVDRDFHLFLENPAAFQTIVSFILLNPDIDAHIENFTDELNVDHFEQPADMESDIK